MRLRSIISVALIAGILAGLACMLFFNFGIGLILWVGASFSGALLLYDIRRKEERRSRQEQQTEKDDENQGD